jgi:hypothetical protein
MTLTIKINCDNAAFDEPGETARILSIAARSAEMLVCNFKQGGKTKGDALLFDSNGNRVGIVRIGRRP